jgi:hypothetical protein
MLKTEAKGISGTAQQRGHETFEKQTCLRIGDRLVMDKVGMCDFMQQQAQEREDRIAEQKKKGDRFSRELGHFQLWREGKKVQASNRFGKLRDPDEQSGDLPDVVKQYLLTEDVSRNHFEVFSEVIIRNDSYIRAWPNYRNTGAWYDFVQVQWEYDMLPARVLCFYNKKVDDGEAKPYALVHVVDENSKGKVKNTVDSLLTTHYKMEYFKRNRSASTHPSIRSVPVESIDSAVIGCLHKPSKLLFDPHCRAVMIVRPRNEWAYLWISWNEELLEENKKKKRSYVSLGEKKLISRVRDNAAQKLTIQTDLNY